MSTENDESRQKLSATHKSLRAYLKLLEEENRLLAFDLKKKRENRAHRLSEYQQQIEKSRRHLEQMEGHIQNTGEQARQQREILDRVQDFYLRSEKQLQGFSNRLLQIETSIEVEGATVDSLRGDLVNMLQELQTMRKRRETLLNSVDDLE